MELSKELDIQMIDLHTHTVFSDGALIPAELLRRARVAGYGAVALTDHVDFSNMELVLSNQRKLGGAYGAMAGIDVFFGVEVTHVVPGKLGDAISMARELGAEVVVVHGETVVEPVARGTNLAAIEAGCDVLAHPGLITPEEARLAAERGVLLEVTTRKGHSLTNGHVVRTAREAGASVVINNDAHCPGDFVGREMRRAVGLGAGLSEEELTAAENAARRFVDSLVRRHTV